jgi:hypothetical protein
LESETNILPPKEDEFAEGLNLQKKLSVKKNDRVIVLPIPEGNAMSWLSGNIGTAVSDGWFNPNCGEHTINVIFDDRMIGEYAVPMKYLQHYYRQSYVNEVSPYEESDWLISETHKNETNKINQWLKTTPEPYDDFHWNGLDLMIMKDGKIIETIERSVLAENNIIPEKITLIENHKYEYGCLMSYFDIPIWNDVLKLIDDDDLYAEEDGFGLEHEPHATILFGIHDDKVNIDDIKNELIGIDEIQVNVKGITNFSNDNEPYDVVKFDIESDLLHQLNKKMNKFPNTNEFDFNPHMTIGYVKKGLGNKYNGKFPSLPTVIGKHIVYSHPSGQKDRWELPIKSDVMNSPEDLLEGLNLSYKRKTSQPISQIFEIYLSEETIINVDYNDEINWGFIEEIEQMNDWINIKVKYYDLYGDTKLGVLGSFKDTYFKIGKDFYYLFDENNFSLHVVSGLELLSIENSNTGERTRLENSYFLSDLSDWLNSMDDIYFNVMSLSDIGITALNRPIKYDYSDVEGPSTIILIQNKFYTINDGLIRDAQVKVG